MAFDFILMLTSNDRTIPDAPAKLEEALKGGVRHIGFKDVGLPLAELKALADAIRAAGGRSYLEVVSLDEEKELASARAAVELEVDCLLGGTRADIVTEVIRHHPIRYYPFAGRITGHPSVLDGTDDEIVASAKALADLEHVHGIDLLAYRHRGDVPRLMSRVCEAVPKPVIMAGSIDREDRVTAAAEAAPRVSPSAPRRWKAPFRRKERGSRRRCARFWRSPRGRGRARRLPAVLPWWRTTTGNPICAPGSSAIARRWPDTG